MITLFFSKAIIKRLYKELNAALQSNDFKLYRIVQTLIWYAEGVSGREISDHFKISRSTIYNWLIRFTKSQFPWLMGKRYIGRGRKSKLTAAQRQKIYDAVVAGPEANGFDCGVWNTAMIATLIYEKFKVNYNLNYLSSLLKSIGLSFQKAKFVTDKEDKEDYQKAREDWVGKTWPKLLRKAKKRGSVILFGDEVSFAMWGSLSQTWAPIGKQPTVKTTGSRKSIKMFGAIEFYKGDFHYQECLDYKITITILKKLKEEGVSKEIVDKLRSLKSELFKGKDAFEKALTSCLTQQEIKNYLSILLSKAKIPGKFSGESYIEFLKYLLNNIKGSIILVEDGASYHKSKIVNNFVKENKDRLHIESLPVFSPDFNPIEKLWKNTKKNATHLKYFKTLDELRSSVITVFKKYMKDASQVICVMQKMRTKAKLA